jgi:ubiquinone/menaquinone biosynthesis C-methylase UbiE
MEGSITVSSVGTNNERNRETWVRTQIEGLPAGCRILDAGAGEQRYRSHCSHLRYVAQDFAQYHPSLVPVGLQMDKWDYSTLDIVSDITAIPQPDGSFDAVLCVEVLEHVLDPIAALRELSRLLSSGGILLLTAPFCSMTHFAPFHYSTGFSRFWYEAVLPTVGLSIEEIVPNGSYFEYIAQEVHRLPEMMERYAARRMSIMDRVGKRLLLHALQRCVAEDTHSSELMCHGYHIRSRKGGLS